MSTTSSHFASPWLIVLGALTLGLVAGAGAAMLQRGDLTTSPARKAATGAVDSQGGRSTLGREAALSPIAREQQGIIEQRRAEFAARSQSMSADQRIKAALSIVSRLEGNSNYRWDVQEVLEMNMELSATLQPADVPDLLALIASGESGMEAMQVQYLQSVAFTLAAKAGMTELLTQLGELNSQARYSAMNSFMAEAATRDPFQGIAMLRQLDTAEFSSHWGIGSLYGWAAQADPERAFRLAQENADLQEKENALQGVLSMMAKEGGLEKALSMCDGITEDGLRFKAQLRILHVTAQESSASREKIITMLEGGDFSPAMRKQAMETIVRDWGYNDPAGVFDWAAERLARGGDDADTYNGQISSVLSSYLRKNPRAAMEKVVALPAELRAQHLQSLISSLAGKNVELAQEALGKLSVEEVTSVRPQLVGGWAANSPVKAAEYVEKLGNVPERGEMVSSLIDAWAGVDQQAASVWLAKQPPTTDRDPGVTSLVYAIQREDPEAAALWALQISNEGRRESVTRDTVNNWAQRKPDEARGWVHAQTQLVGAEQAAAMLKSIDEIAKQKQ